MFDSHMQCNFCLKTFQWSDGLASLTKKDCLHLVYIWLSHAMLFLIKRKNRSNGWMGLRGKWPASHTKKDWIYLDYLWLSSGIQFLLKKTKSGTTGRIARFDLKKELDSPSLHLTFTCHVIFTKIIRSERWMSLKGRWARFVCKKQFDSP